MASPKKNAGKASQSRQANVREAERKGGLKTNLRKTAPAKASDSKASPGKGPSLKIKELLERVVAATGAKKKDAKVFVDSVLLEIGTALANGEEVNLPGLGRARVVKTSQRGEVNVLNVKLKQGKAKSGADNSQEALADD